jgi:mannose-6-phosphate isomerase-like protein (cupin superfamily)
MNFKNLEDSTVFSDTTFTKRILFANEQVLSFVLNLKTGQALPLHKHEHSTLIMLTLSGSGEVKVNSELEKIKKGSVVVVKGEDEFSVPNVDEDMSLLVTISPNPTNEMYSNELG